MRFFGAPPQPAVAKNETMRVVVVEDGARPSGAGTPADGAVFVLQADGESPSSLALRVAAQIVMIEAARESFAPAVLIMGNDREPQVAAARALIARALFSHMAARGSGELVLEASDDGATVRDELLSLVEALLEEYPESRVSIRVQLPRRERRARSSGIYAVPNAVCGVRSGAGGTGS